MKLIIENWNEAMLAEEEQSAENKSKIFDDVNKEADLIVKKVVQAAAGDKGLASEAMQSLIKTLQDSLERM
tara:strand:+ start:152 stop:364 length:213 start_codon:yes stop_codon:yes gene_type:complete